MTLSLAAPHSNPPGAALCRLGNGSAFFIDRSEQLFGDWGWLVAIYLSQ